jgi:hypothetical protein
VITPELTNGQVTGGEPVAGADVVGCDHCPVPFFGSPGGQSRNHCDHQQGDGAHPAQQK